MKKITNISKKLCLSLFIAMSFQALSVATDPGSLEAINSASSDRRNIIGVEMSTATDGQRATVGCKEGGVYVSAVIAGHPAESAGLKVGDIVAAINSTHVEDLSGALEVMNGLDAGKKYIFTVHRRIEEVPVTLEVNVLIEKVQERAIGKIS